VAHNGAREEMDVHGKCCGEGGDRQTVAPERYRIGMGGISYILIRSFGEGKRKVIGPFSVENSHCDEKMSTD